MSEEVKAGYEKPIPLKIEYSAPYWDAADRHELVLQKCNSCGSYNHPPGPCCSMCGSQDIVWENQGSNIKGSVYTYIVSYRPFLPGFQDDLPLVIAVVELENLPEVKIIGNVLNATSKDITVGTQVKMIWVDITENRALPQWVLV